MAASNDPNDDWLQRFKSAFAQPVDRISDVAPLLLASSGQASSGGADDTELPPGVDWQFIRDREANGSQGLNGLVPQRNGVVFPQSGATIAHGFDLGQYSTADLQQRLGLPDDLVKTVTPYLGLKGQQAKDYLDENPLSITSGQQDQVDSAVMRYNYNRMAKNYNATATAGTRFQDLPQDAQTAIMSMGQQFGPNMAGSGVANARKFWNQATTGQWPDAYGTLINFGSFQPRRDLEAGLMQNALNSGALRYVPPDDLPRPTPRPDE